MSTRIALVGYGKMGREIERLAPSAGAEITATFDIDRPLASAPADVAAAFDVAIEFSTPGTVIDNIRWLAAHGKHIVVGTTGWTDQLPEVKTFVEKAGVGLIYSSNFSIGMFLFNRLVGDAARAFQSFPEYDIAIAETHHRAKLDAPSGTALTLASTVLNEWKSKKGILPAPPAHGSAGDALIVSSSRVGAVVGEHTVRIDSAADTITLTHAAHSRAGFASGALRAAAWIAGRTGVFSMEDFMASVIANRE